MKLCERDAGSAEIEIAREREGGKRRDAVQKKQIYRACR